MLPVNMISSLMEAVCYTSQHQAVLTVRCSLYHFFQFSSRNVLRTTCRPHQMILKPSQRVRSVLFECHVQLLELKSMLQVKMQFFY